jgi:hypothetical protein
MRKSLFYILLLAAAGACTAEEQDNPLVNGPTCYDGIRNQDEEEVDCGGRCEACNIVNPILTPCTTTLKDNTLLIDGIEEVLDPKDFSCESSTSGYTVTVTMGTSTFILFLGGSGRPDEDGSYPLVRQTYFVDWGDAAINYRDDGFGPFATDEGEVYVRVKKDQFTAEFCNLDLTYDWGNGVSHRNVAGRISGCVK